MVKKKNKKTIKKKVKSSKQKDKGIKTAREKMIGQHIGYRYDVNLLPDYNRLTPFLKKYIEHMGWDDLNWLEDVHMGYENGKPAVFDRNINGWVTTPPKLKLPNPNIHSAIMSSAKGEEEKLAIGLATLHEEDPTFIYRVDSEVNQTIISGQGELHLRVTTERLKRRFGIGIILTEPKIPYRETINGKGAAKYRHKKQSGGAGQFAEVWMRIESKERGHGIEFTNSLVGQNVDRVFVASVEKGVNKVCNEGIIANCKVVDLKVDFYDGKMHPVDSKDIAFQTAGAHAFREAFQSAQPCLLEPILDIDVKVPEEFMGDIMGDISSKRGKIMGMVADGSFQLIKAKVPQAELYNYATTVRSLTGGRGIHSESFSHYEMMPKEIEKKVISLVNNDNED